jgi:hypothetical protein
MAFTTDCWSSITQTPFIGVTTHFITKDWELQSILLDFGELNGHTGKQIAKQFIGTLKKFDIELDKVSIYFFFH